MARLRVTGVKSGRLVRSGFGAARYGARDVIRKMNSGARIAAPRGHGAPTTYAAGVLASVGAGIGAGLVTRKVVRHRALSARQREQRRQAARRPRGPMN